MELIASWSGGKDSCHALYKALQEGQKIQALLTMMQDQSQSNFHMIPTRLLDAQSEALGIPITKVSTTPETYEQQFKTALRQAKQNGAEGILTGDIYDVAQHQAGWLDSITTEIGLEPVRPLWHRNTDEVYNEFVNAGFKATVVRVKSAVLGMDYLGRTLDKQFYADLKKLGNVDPCGENGEYHTFVRDGPIFSKAIEIQQTQTSTINSWGRLEITKFTLTPKPKQ
jgi:diphthine-ammonia ligase